MAAALRLLFGLALLPALVQDPSQDPKLPQDPIRDWKYILKDITRIANPKNPAETLEVEEVSLMLGGKEAVPINFDKKIFDLRGVSGSYFTQPEKGKLSKEIQIEARKGRYDNQARTLRLEDHVHVVKHNDEEKPEQAPTVLDASSLLLRFIPVYECPKCKIAQKTPGRCREHDLPLRSTTVTSVEADRDFLMKGPEGVLSGEGLVTDDALEKEYHITKNGFVEFEGGQSPLSGEKRTVAVSEPKFSQVFSIGPLHITGPVDQRRILGSGGVRIDRMDSSGTLTLRAQDMDIDTSREIDPKTGAGGAPQIQTVKAQGRVALEGVIFEDGTAFHSTSDHLTRRLIAPPADAPARETLEETVLTATGAEPVHVTTGTSQIDSRRVTLTHPVGSTRGESVFENVSRSDLVAGTQHFALSGDHLVTHAAPDSSGKTDLRDLQARGHVVLNGLLSGAPSGPKSAAKHEEPGSARADAFDWDVQANRGWLEARPFVQITQGPSTILAPKVVLESPKILVLKGPKQVHMIKEAEGSSPKEDYFATCAGDLVMDQSANRLWMWEDCLIKTDQMVLHSDRVKGKLSDSGSGLDSLLALGHVHALKKSDKKKSDEKKTENDTPNLTHLYGGRLFYDLKHDELEIYGDPRAVTDSGSMITVQEQIRTTTENRKGVPTRVTHLIGASEGVMIEIEERLPPPGPNAKK